MHDPLVVAFDIVRPWPQRSSLPASGKGERWRILLHHDHHEPYCSEHNCTGNPFPWWKLRSYARFWRLAGRDYYWPPLVTVWHREPGGADGLSVCSRRVRGRDGRWKYTKSWRWHVHHWKIQLSPLQDLRRWALTRCTWCGGRSVKGDRVNISHSWGGDRAPWWRGERGLFHEDCSTVATAQSRCLCPDPILPPGENFGECLWCGKFRAYGDWGAPAEDTRLLASLPHGSRIPAEMRPRLEAIWAARRAEREAAGG